MDTLINCLPNMTRHEYPALIKFAESENLLLDCNCLESWKQSVIDFESECTNWMRSDKTLSIISTVFVGKAVTTSDDSFTNTPLDENNNTSIYFVLHKYNHLMA